MISLDGTVIGRVQLRGSGDPDQPYRLRRAIEALDLRPRGLAPGAILCIRHLVTKSAPTADEPRPATWADAISDRLTDLARNAAAPADGPVPVTAEAVIFRDEGEMLACLALDFGRPDGKQAWWWHELIRDRSAGVVAKQWRAGIVHVPVAVTNLRRRSVLRRALASLSEADAHDLFLALWRAYALPGFTQVVNLRASQSAIASFVEEGPRSGFADAGASVESGDIDLSAATHRGDLPRAPISSIQPFGTGLSFAHDALATTALALHDAPAYARTSAFVQLIQAIEASWDEPVQGGDALDRAAARRRRTHPESTQKHLRSRNHHATAAPGIRERHALQAAVATGREEPSEAESPVAASLEPIERVVESGLGGVFYLLNLGLYLGLYADFTRPAEGSVGLNPWTFVAQLARVMTGEQDRDDPIWPMLDALADRRSRPIRARAPMPDWRVPPEWLRPFRGWRGEWQWSRAAGRLRIDHPAGFRVIDVLDNERLGPRSALRGYPVRPRLIRVRPRDMVAIRGRAPFARWIELIAAYARPRLGLALGLELGGDQLARLLLRQQAQIHLTESAVDVVFSLASLPLEVRRAGLDRDIGWLPAAGRYIRFHFE